MDKKIDDELTYKIIGCEMKVHNTLGNGFQGYLNTYQIDKGLPINFGSTSLEIKR